MEAKNSHKKNNMKLFIYAIIPATAPQNYAFTGINGAPLRTVQVGLVSLLVSDFKEKTIRPERKHLSIFHEVHKKLFEQTYFLPIRFGVIANNAANSMKLIAVHQQDFLKQLEKISNTVEMGLKMSWDIENIFEYIIAIYPEIKQTHNEMLAKNGKEINSFEDKIQLGQLFSEALKSEREVQAKKMQDIFSDIFIEFAENPCHKNNEVFNFSCLINKDQVSKFEAIVVNAAKQFNDDFMIVYNGPWVPYSFVKMNGMDLN